MINARKTIRDEEKALAVNVIPRPLPSESVEQAGVYSPFKSGFVSIRYISQFLLVDAVEDIPDSGCARLVLRTGIGEYGQGVDLDFIYLNSGDPS